MIILRFKLLTLPGSVYIISDSSGSLARTHTQTHTLAQELSLLPASSVYETVLQIAFFLALFNFGFFSHIVTTLST